MSLIEIWLPRDFIGLMFVRMRRLSLLALVQYPSQIPGLESILLRPKMSQVVSMFESDLYIKSDLNGRSALVFRPGSHDFVPPETHEERMEWVRSSFSKFYSRLQEAESLAPAARVLETSRR